MVVTGNNDRISLLDKVVCGYIFIEIFLMSSSMLQHFLSLKFFYGIAALTFGCIFCIIALKEKFSIPAKYVYILLVTLIFTMIAMIRLESREPLRISIIVSLIILMLYKRKYLEIIVKIGTPLFIVLLIGAFIGFSYAISGFPPIFEFPNPDSRTNYIFLTTCTNVYISQVVPGMTNIIRPSGIYDEPGNFSFFLCILSVFRILTGKNDFVTFFMLLAGNITFSVTHAIFFVFFNFYMLGKYHRKKIFLGYIVIAVLGTSFMLYKYYDILDKMLFYRLQGNELTDNNRSVQIEESISALQNAPSFVDIILFGEPDISTKVGFIYTNPLGPLVCDGLLVSWIYYVCMAILLLGGIVLKKYRFVFWAIVLVYAQRPGYAVFGSSTALYIIVITVANMTHNEIKNIFSRRKRLALCKIQ